MYNYKYHFHFRLDNEYVFIGYSNGVLRVHYLPKKPPSIHSSSSKYGGIQPWSTENYWTISLHSPTGGAIRDIYTIETQQAHLLVCCGQDGGIFAHKISQALDNIYQQSMNKKVIHYKQSNIYMYTLQIPLILQSAIILVSNPTTMTPMICY